MKLIKRFIRTFKNYPVAYVAVDLHETTLKPTWNKTLAKEYYPLAKKTLQMMSKREDVILIMWSSSTKKDLMSYDIMFSNDQIWFNYINENPDCKNTEYADFNTKMYFDIGLDDRFGFNPYIEWPILFIYFWIKKVRGK